MLLRRSESFYPVSLPKRRILFSHPFLENRCNGNEKDQMMNWLKVQLVIGHQISDTRKRRLSTFCLYLRMRSEPGKGTSSYIGNSV